MDKTLQAKHISDVALLEAVRAASMRVYPPWTSSNHWVFTTQVEEAFPAIPPKVIRAKCAALIRRKLLDGCTCGCRGDFELTDAGLALLVPTPRG